MAGFRELPLLPTSPPDSGVFVSWGSEDLPTSKGTLIVHGTNGRLPGGNRGRKCSRIDIVQRHEANGVKPGAVHPLESFTAQGSGYAVNWQFQDRKFVQVFVDDSNTDMFQTGRGSDRSIDLVVVDSNIDIALKRKKPSAVSRFACRLYITRHAQSTRVNVFAACFDEKKNMVLGDKAIVWQEEEGFDALTTNGVLVFHIQGDFIGGNATPGMWREVSVMGALYSVRDVRSSTQKGRRILGESNRLTDGSMIDLCGVTLLWRTPESLARGPSRNQLDEMLRILGTKGYSCPQGKAPLIFTYGARLPPPGQTPHVYLGCGHVAGMGRYGNPGDELQCPVCLLVSTFVNLTMGVEPAFWVDRELPSHAFNPCGHMASEKTIKYWAKVPLPRGTSGFIAACPFCATPLVDYPGYCRLIFALKPAEP